jgi:8-oxo-dGTP diphosphatase
VTADPLIVSAVAVIRDRRVLMVTARGRDVYYMPGGKVDPGETAAQAAAREAFEEVSLEFAADDLEELFEVRTQAHGEPDGRMVHMRVFRAWTDDDPVPSAEVGAVHWTTAADADRCPPAGVEVLRRLASLGLID